MAVTKGTNDGFTDLGSAPAEGRNLRLRSEPHYANFMDKAGRLINTCRGGSEREGGEPAFPIALHPAWDRMTVDRLFAKSPNHRGREVAG